MSVDLCEWCWRPKTGRMGPMPLHTDKNCSATHVTARNNVLLCNREEGHTKDHVICGAHFHAIHRWSTWVSVDIARSRESKGDKALSHE